MNTKEKIMSNFAPLATVSTIEGKEVGGLKSKLSRVEKQANEITIASQEENVQAMEIKVSLSKIGKEIKERKEAITKPLNEALKSARELFKPIEEQFENAENIVGKKLITYKQKVEAEAREAESKIAARVEKGTLKMETAERKLDEIKTPEKTVQTDHGRVQFRKIQKMRIINANLIPDKYWEINETLLRKDVLAGIVVPGAEKYEEETV